MALLDLVRTFPLSLTIARRCPQPVEVLRMIMDDALECYTPYSRANAGRFDITKLPDSDKLLALLAPSLLHGVERNTTARHFNNWLARDSIQAHIVHVDFVVTCLDRKDGEDWRHDVLWSAQPTARSCRIEWRNFGKQGRYRVEEQQMSLFVASLRTFHQQITILSMGLEKSYIDAGRLFRYILRPLQAYSIPAITLRDSSIFNSVWFPNVESAPAVLQLSVHGSNVVSDARALYQILPNLAQLSLKHAADAFWRGLPQLGSLKHLCYEHCDREEWDELVYERFAQLTTLETLEVLNTVCANGNATATVLLTLPATLTRLSLFCDEEFAFALERLLPTQSFLPSLKALNLSCAGASDWRRFGETVVAIAAICKIRSIVLTQARSIFNTWVA
jgi:hypothetical protein